MFIDKIIETDQWKQTKRSSTNFRIDSKLSDLLGFRRLDVHYGSINAEDAMYIRDTCKNFPELEKYSLWAHVDGNKKIVEKFGSGAIDYSVRDGFLLITTASNFISFEKINK